MAESVVFSRHSFESNSCPFDPINSEQTLCHSSTQVTLGFVCQVNKSPNNPHQQQQKNSSFFSSSSYSNQFQHLLIYILIANLFLGFVFVFDLSNNNSKHVQLNMAVDHAKQTWHFNWLKSTIMQCATTTTTIVDTQSSQYHPYRTARISDHTKQTCNYIPAQLYSHKCIGYQ